MSTEGEDTGPLHHREQLVGEQSRSRQWAGLSPGWVASTSTAFSVGSITIGELVSRLDSSLVGEVLAPPIRLVAGVFLVRAVVLSHKAVERALSCVRRHHQRPLPHDEDDDTPQCSFLCPLRESSPRTPWHAREVVTIPGDCGSASWGQGLSPWGLRWASPRGSLRSAQA
jgi:hypothetical protein